MPSTASAPAPPPTPARQPDTLQTSQIVCIDEQNPYFQMIHNTWGQRLREVFESIDDPCWNGAESAHPLMSPLQRHEPMRKITQPGERIV